MSARAFARVLLACAALAAASLAPAPAHAQRIALARVEVAGPCRALAARLEPAGAPTELALDIPAGSRSVLELPLLLPPGLAATDLALLRAPRLEPAGGSASFVGWVAPSTLERWSRLPAGLRARPRTAPASARPVPSLAACALLVGAGCAALVARRRGVRVALGLAALALGWGLASRGTGPRALRVCEVDAAAERALEWRSARGGLELELDGLAHALAEPPGLPAGARLSAARATGPWQWRSAGARLWTARELALAELATAPLAAAWSRRAGGEWECHGAAVGDPPGWLLAGLPMGVDAVLASFAPDEFGAERGWLRWVGAFDGRLPLPR